MHQASLPYFSPPSVNNPKAFQKFANLFPNVAASNAAMAAAVSNLNPFSIESLLASPQTAAAAATAAQQQQAQQQQRLNYNQLLTSTTSPTGQKQNPYSPIQSIPQDLYG